MGAWHLLVCVHGMLLLTLSRAVVRICDCTTNECIRDQRTTCTALYFCYVQYTPSDPSATVIKGCIDDRTPLLCENKSPKNMIRDWPVHYCCDKHNYCNRNVIPSAAVTKALETTRISESMTTTRKPTRPTFTRNETTSHMTHASNTPEIYSDDTATSYTINPIYIAVPIAGICVLLALVIFAIYLLRRRNEFYDNYYYQDTKPAVAVINSDFNKMNGKVNRCTDSERSSSGSETKLFLPNHV